MWKELWILIRMLFSSKPSDVNEVLLKGMNHFPFKGYSYMMWCGKMIYRNDTLERRKKEWLTKSFRTTKNHETIHLMQAKMCGSWVKYYWRYFCEWIKGGPIMAPASAAYYTIPFEVEAYANEGKLDYCTSYDGSNLPKYTFKNRKKLYRNAGGSPTEWKAYIRAL